MKNKVTAVISAALALWTVSFTAFAADSQNVKINSKNFPDSEFRSYVSDMFDTDGDGSLSKREMGNVTEIEFENYDAQSLEGIGFFTRLTELDCSGNEITSLDLSKNTALEELDCSVNSLKSLDISKCTRLTELDCSGNKLKELDVSKNKRLEDIDCSDNKITALNVSYCTALEELKCYDNNLSSLNAEKCSRIEELDCTGNSKLKKITVSKKAKIEELYTDDDVKVTKK